MHHQLYDGKRINITITDNYNNSLETKLDIGVHKYFELEQDKYVFDLGVSDESVALFINSPEQIICEKLKSLIKFGIRSTRYKDVFDFYYLINNGMLNKDKLINYIYFLIIKDDKVIQSTLKEINLRLKSILNNKQFISRLDNARSNWIDIPVNKVVNNIIDYFTSLETEKI